MAQQLVSLAKSQHIDLSFDEVEELLPFKWSLKDVKAARSEGEPLYAKKVILRLSYFPFCITSIDIIEGSYCRVPFSLTAKGKFAKEYEISTFLIDSKFFQLNGSALLSSSLQPLKAEFFFHIPELVECHPLTKGSLQGKIHLQSEFAHATLDFHEVKIEEFKVGSLNADLTASLKGNAWKGNLIFAAPSSFEGSFSFQFDPTASLFDMSQVEVKGLDSHLSGNLSFDPFSWDWKEGSFQFEALHLEHFRFLAADSFLKGAAFANIKFFPSNLLTIHGHVENLDFYSASLQAAVCECHLSKELEGNIAIEGENLNISEGFFSSFKIDSSFGKENAPFSLSATGDPLDISLRGSWNQKESLFSIECQELLGQLFDQSYQIEKPFHIEWCDKHFKMTPFFLKIGNGHLFTHVDLGVPSAFAKIEATKLPLDFVSLFQKDFTLDGTSDIDFEIAAHDDHLSGNIDLSFNNVDLISEGKKESIPLTGSLKIDLNEKEADVRGKLQTPCAQHLELFAQVPIQFHSFPFKLKSDQQKPFSAELTMKSKVQDLLQFINIGDQQLEGWLTCHLNFSNHLLSPILQGTLELQEGIYENLSLGLSLKQIEGRAIAAGQEIKLITFKANDGSKGSMSGSGIIKLDPNQSLVYSIDSHLDEFQALSLDTLEGKFTGNLLFTGNRKEAKAQGRLSIAEAHFKIPEKLPPVIPDLLINFIHTPESLLKKPLKPLSLFPIHLDLELNAADQVFLDWKGLSSEWKGNLHVSGNHLNVQARGALSLIKGEYNFASKTFSLSEGKMIFNDQSSPAMYLTLSGACELADTNVKVILRGPLFSPTLTFQSSPTMPTSSLLARILFNKDITEISAVQAFQLAQTLLTLSGDTAPNILERVRKTLFIDRLNVVTSDNNEILLQVSKYLTKGVMMTLSQGFDTQKVTMDFELNQDFLLQAEVDKEQKGKFSLKWNHNY